MTIRLFEKDCDKSPSLPLFQDGKYQNVFLEGVARPKDLEWSGYYDIPPDAVDTFVMVLPAPRILQSPLVTSRMTNN